ncbi:Transcription initiation factor TFIIB, partial [Pseudoloma neurophilia]
MSNIRRDDQSSPKRAGSNLNSINQNTVNQNTTSLNTTTPLNTITQSNTTTQANTITQTNTITQSNLSDKIDSTQKRKKLIVKKNEPFCKDCNTDQYILDDPKTGSVLCSNCGAVISTSLIDEKSEWRSFEENSLNPSRV